MHPTATLLALHGCQLYRVGTSKEWPIYAALPRAPERDMVGLFFVPSKGDWVCQLVYRAEHYMLTDWLAVPDRKWGVLRPDLLHRFIESITA
ncbi:hypothetical protein [Burkholderia cenocepacia]|uniref:hypothetical protein n=1 Tax=Burkholderia cenocepacia TaxID=95486 RepID=UPI002654B4C1|nr:hypothetical protein [Burkholderia cenocepacia]MDN7537050.1 hypothetical protein [Burkholderia cenocepacia]